MNSYRQIYKVLKQFRSGDKMGVQLTNKIIIHKIKKGGKTVCGLKKPKAFSSGWKHVTCKNCKHMKAKGRW